MKLLAAVELSADHEWVITQTASWAEKLSATVDLLHVSPPSILPGADETPGHLRKRLEGLMDLVPLLLRGRCLLRSGDPGTQILQEADGYDLLVVATHGRTGVSRVVMGSVAEHVTRQADIPTLVLRLSQQD